MHVDGFRFDLAVSLAREGHHFAPRGRFLAAIIQDPVLAGAKLIAEPWDLGPGGYQLGGFPPGWSEWNDKYRDSMRRFWRGETGIVSDLAFRLAGSSDVFGRRGRRPTASVNFITAHDGFTLEDLVTFEDKHNLDNGEENADGTAANYSWNCGIEGPSVDPAVAALRDKQKRNMMATVLLSLGVPMIVAGDEFGRTQRGNNNAYCQDNEISWLDWTKLDRNRQFFHFVRDLMKLRTEHPTFHQARFFHGEHIDGEGGKDIAWLSPDGQEMTEDDWRVADTQCLGVRYAAARAGNTRPEEEHPDPSAFLLLMNAGAHEIAFTLPNAQPNKRWIAMIETTSGALPLKELFDPGTLFHLPAHSLALFGGKG
jgi:glycogen operon protein